MKITVVGTGGVGGYFGGRLAQAGNDVTFIARGAHLDAMQKNGLQIKSIKGDFAIHPVSATSQIKESGIPDLVLIATKAWQVREVAQELLPVIGEHTMVLPLQNGVLASEELKEVLPHANVLSGLCRIFSMIESPGVVKHVGVEPTIVFGECDNRKTERVEKVLRVFETAGIQARISNHIQTDLWKKFLLICSGGILAVTRSTYGEVRQLPETRQMLYQLFTEIQKLAQLSGVPMDAQCVEEAMATVDTYSPESTTSLTRDVWNGKPSEIHYQNGSVVNLANQIGFEVPINQFLYHSILPMEHRARSLGV